MARSHLLESNVLELFENRPFEKRGRDDLPENDSPMKLSDYFLDWEGKTPEAIIGAFAAVVAGDDSEIRIYAESKLGGRTLDGLRSEICESADWNRFGSPVVSVLDEQRFEVTNLLGDWIEATPPSVGELTTFFSAGSPSAGPDGNLTLRLRSFPSDRFEDPEKLTRILRKSLAKVVETHFSVSEKDDLGSLLDQLCERSQIGVEMAKVQAVDQGLGYLWNLTMGMNREEPSVVVQLLEELEEARNEKAEKSTSRRQDVRDRAEVEYVEFEKKSKDRFRELLESFSGETPCPEEKLIIDAVRRKISEDCMYSLSSFPSKFSECRRRGRAVGFRLDRRRGSLSGRSQ